MAAAVASISARSPTSASGRMPGVRHGRDHAVQLVLATRHDDDMRPGLGQRDSASKPDPG